MKRTLHIGVFKDGRIVDERYAPETGTVSIGRSADNTIPLIGSSLPDHYVIATFERNVPVLHVAPGMKGELALDGKTRKPLEELRSKGKTQTNGWILDLPEATRGWVAYNEATFFLQIAAKPLPPPRNTLPTAARSGIFSRLEPIFTAVFVCAFLVESGAIIAINRQPDIDPDAPLTGEDLDRFATVVVKKQEEKPKEDDDAKKKAEEEARKKAEEEARKRKNETAEQKAAHHAEDVKKAVASSALLQVLGTTGGNGALADVFATGKGFTDIASALQGAGGIKIANGDEGPMHKGGSGDGTVDIGDLGKAVGSGGAGVKFAEKTRVVPQIAIDDNDVEVDSTTVDKDALNKFVRLRLRSIQSCYERELKLNPALKGKIVVRFTVTAAGRVGECSIDSDTMRDEAVSSCIVRLVRSWNFPFKPEEDVPVTFPFVFQPGG